MPPPREQCNAGPMARNQRLLLGARPPFDLAFRCDCVGDDLEMLGKHQADRPTLSHIAVEPTFVMLSDAPLKIGASDANVVAAIRTMQNLNTGTAQRAIPILRDAPDGAPQDEDGERTMSIRTPP